MESGSGCFQTQFLSDKGEFMNKNRILIAAIGLWWLVALPNCVIGPGNWIFFIDQPASTNEGAAIELATTLHYEAGSDQLATIDTTVWCAALPEDWSTSGPVTFQFGNVDGGLDTISGPAVYLTQESADMNADEAVTTGGLLSSWNCYGLGSTMYTGYEMWKYTLPATVGAAGSYTVYHAAWSGKALIQGKMGDRLVKTTVVGGDAGTFANWEVVNAMRHDMDIIPAGITVPVLANANIARGNGVWVLTAMDLDDGNASVVFRSGDGKVWEHVRNLEGLVSHLNFNDGVFLAVALDTGTLAGNDLWKSSDGLTWSSTSPGINMRSAVYAEDRYVAVGQAGQVAWSDDGSAWTLSTRGASNWQDVTWGGGNFVAIGSVNQGAEEELVFMVSPDGASWTNTVLSGVRAGSSMPRIIYGDGRFLATSDYPVLYSSSDGSTWDSSRIANSDTSAVFGLTVGSGTIMAVGVEGTSGYNSGVVYTSEDDGPWEKWYPGTSEWLMDVEYSDGRFTAAGTGYLVIRSNSLTGGGGGGGGCNTAGPAPGEPFWPEMMWLVLLAGMFMLMRRKVTEK